MSSPEARAGQDATEALVARVRAAGLAKTPLRIVGGDTKFFYGRPVAGESLSLSDHHGVLHYDPAELVITARSGTRLADIEATLARHGQHLPFEPPCFGAQATLGGAVASGLAGPARLSRGPVRDYVLGARLLTGDGRVLKFGGEVMKNVAGYDVSRLLAGSLGILGVLLDVSLKVLPIARGTCTVTRNIDAQDALDWLDTMARYGMPVSASFWTAGVLCVRLEGSAPSLDDVRQRFGGDIMESAAAVEFWRSVRDQSHPFFGTARPLWRLSLPVTATGAALAATDQAACEWNGAQAWISGVGREPIMRIANTAGGHATLFRPDDGGSDGEVFAPLPAPLLDLHRAVKRVFDPAGILNPGRMYAGL